MLFNPAASVRRSSAAHSSTAGRGLLKSQHLFDMPGRPGARATIDESSDWPAIHEFYDDMPLLPGIFSA
jgi:hypothetical protein